MNLVKDNYKLEVSTFLKCNTPFHRVETNLMQVTIHDCLVDNTLQKQVRLSFFWVGWWGGGGGRKREISRESYLWDQILLNLLEKRDKREAS